jgi:hypothetical protein
MSNPSGPDQDATPTPDEAQAADEQHEPVQDETYETSGPADPTHKALKPSETPTEVLSSPDRLSQEMTQRRYSAPSGFDARTTEVIRTPPDAFTEVMAVTPPANPSAPTAAVAGPRPIGPQAIPPDPDVGRHRSWGLVAVLILVIAALAVIAVLGTIWLTQNASPKVSQEDLVRQTIQDFDIAIQKGDLGQLRGITCGRTRDNYVGYPDKDWTTTHDRVARAKQYPVVASIDQVVVNDQHAEANVTTFMAYAPQVRSTRSFDLQFVDGRWKICEGPIS